MKSEETRQRLIRPGGLAHRLKEMRSAAGLSGDQMARALGGHQTKVSKIENGHTLPSEGDIRNWVAACGQPAALAEELLSLREEGQAMHREWRQRLRKGHASVQGEWNALERAAENVFNFEMFAIPGLLQTPDYARAMMQQAVRAYGASPDGIDAAVAARSQRQEVLYDSSHTFMFVIWEPALMVGAAPPDVMIGQLLRLIDLAKLPHVTIGIIPLGEPVRTFLQNSFIALDQTVRAETFGGLITMTGAEADAYLTFAARLADDALKGDAAAQVIARAIQFWRNTRGGGERQ